MEYFNNHSFGKHLASSYKEALGSWLNALFQHFDILSVVREGRLRKERSSTVGSFLTLVCNNVARRMLKLWPQHEHSIISIYGKLEIAPEPRKKSHSGL